MSVRWWSQPFAPEGSAAAEGIVKQLGRPSLDPLTVLVREAAQNSWDAHLLDGVVEFHIDVRVLGKKADAWRRLLLPGPSTESNVDLEKALEPDAVLLVISDRNTVGLGGPLRASERATHDEKADFVQFLRNVGEPGDHEFGGGTYGFGKGIFYRLSRVGAILVDTNTAAGGPTARRLMGAALGHSWYLGDRRFTGRHWWGDIAADNVPDPVLAAHADVVAGELGLPGFADGRTGTDIVILAAELGSVGAEWDARSRTPHEAATFIASSILWHLWPKMVKDENGRHMRFVVGVDGSGVPVPQPETFEQLAPFVEALQEVRAGNGVSYSRTVVPRHAGSFAMALGAGDTGSARLLVEAAKPYDGSSHHIARMRVAELVVDYLPGPPHPDTRLAYGGVFKASTDADALFASSEPPTHDDWVAKGLSGSARGVVIGARTFVQKQLDERLGLGPQVGGPGGQGLGQLSAMLAGVIPARLHLGHSDSTWSDESTLNDKARSDDARPMSDPAHGNDAGGMSDRAMWRGETQPQGQNAATWREDTTRQREGPVLRRGGRPRIMGTPTLQIHENGPCFVAAVKVPAADFTRVVSADVEVVLEGGGRESEPPLGAAIPQITQWRSVSGEVVASGGTFRLPAGEESDWFVYATYVTDAVVRFKVSQVSSDAD